MRSNLRELVNKKEVREKRIIQQQEIARETGLTEATVSKWMSFKEFSMVYAKPAAALMRWVPCGLDELITVEEMFAAELTEEMV